METHGDGLIEQFQWFTVKSPLLITFIILAGVLFVVAVLVEYFRQRMVARARVDASIREFERLAKQKELTEDETRYMYRLAKYARLDSPLQLATSSLRFDETVHDKLERLRNTPDQGDAEAEIYGSIRRKLELNRIPLGYALPSTRFLSVGQRLAIDKNVPSGSPASQSEVVAVDERGFFVKWPERAGAKTEFHVGDPVRVAMWRTDDARYFFDTEIRAIIAEPNPRLMLRHSKNVVRIQSRKSFRITSTASLVLIYVPGEKVSPTTTVEIPTAAIKQARRLSARISTLSGGGVSVVTTQKIPVDSVVRTHIPIEGIGAPVPVACRVLDAASSRSAGKYVLRMEFAVIDEEDQDRIFRYISKKQHEQFADNE